MTVQEIWDECERMQIEIMSDNEQCKLISDNFDAGKILALREIQYFISKKCSRYPEAI